MIKVKYDNQYLSYILEDNTSFFTTGYRVLKKQKNTGYISCSKLSYNGQIKLLYPIGEYIPVSTAAESWKLNDIFEWILKILKVLMEVQDNGFLQIDTVDMDLSHMFVDPEEKRVHIVVLPLTTETNMNSGYYWEDNLEKSLISLIEISQMKNSLQSMQIKQVIRENISSLKNLYTELRKIAESMDVHVGSKKPAEDEEKSKEKMKDKVLHFVSRSAAHRVDIIINKEQFVLGRHPKLADGVLNVSPTIGRRHCMILQEKDMYYIQDLDSANHTYLNGEMLKKEEVLPLKQGDQVRLAEVEFVIDFQDK